MRPGNQVWGGCAPDFISACGKGDNNANREALFRNDSDKKKVNHSKKLEERGSADWRKKEASVPSESGSITLCLPYCCKLFLHSIRDTPAYLSHLHALTHQTSLYITTSQRNTDAWTACCFSPAAPGTKTPQAEQEFKTLKYLLQGILTISTKYLWNDSFLRL